MVLAFVAAVQIIQQLKLMLGGGKLCVFPSHSVFVVCFVLFFSVSILLDFNLRAFNLPTY